MSIYAYSSGNAYGGLQLALASSSGYTGNPTGREGLTLYLNSSVQATVTGTPIAVAKAMILLADSSGAVNLFIGNQFALTSDDISRGYAEIVKNLVLPSDLNYYVSTDLYKVACSRGAEGYPISAFVSRISVQLLDADDSTLCTIFDSTHIVENVDRRGYGNYFGFAYPPKKLRIRFYLNGDAAAGDKIIPTSSTVFIPYGE